MLPETRRKRKWRTPPWETPNFHEGDENIWGLDKAGRNWPYYVTLNCLLKNGWLSILKFISKNVFIFIDYFGISHYVPQSLPSLPMSIPPYLWPSLPANPKTRKGGEKNKSIFLLLIYLLEHHQIPSGQPPTPRKDYFFFPCIHTSGGWEAEPLSPRVGPGLVHPCHHRCHLAPVWREGAVPSVSIAHAQLCFSVFSASITSG